MLAGLAVAPAAASAKTVWLCKPGLKADPCSPSLDTTRFSPGGRAARHRCVKRARPRRIDCFYVYPTVSGQPTPAANRRIDPELRSIALYQAARYSRDCRVFAPVYRQITLAGLFGGADTAAIARARLRRRARRVARLPRAPQPRPRRRADRPLAGHVPAAPADHRGDRPAAEAAAPARLRAAARRQRDRARRARTPAATSSTCAPAARTASSAASSRSRRSTHQCPRTPRSGAPTAPGPRGAVHEPGGARRRRGADRLGRPERAVRARDAVAVGDRRGRLRAAGGLDARGSSFPGSYSARCSSDGRSGRAAGRAARRRARAQRRRRTRPGDCTWSTRTSRWATSRGSSGARPRRTSGRARALSSSADPDEEAGRVARP